MAKLLLLFIALPAVELALLIEVGSRIGTLPTLAIIATTGLLGASLANREGLRTLRAIQQQLEQGKLPAGPVVDGLIILVAGALLITPGILTDAVGFACLIPVVRNAVRRSLLRRFERAVREQRIHVVAGVFDGSPPGRVTYDVTPERPPADDEPPPRRRLS